MRPDLRDPHAVLPRAPCHDISWIFSKETWISSRKKYFCMMMNAEFEPTRRGGKRQEAEDASVCLMAP